MKDEVKIIKIPIRSNNPYIRDIIGYIQLETTNLPSGYDTSEFKIRIKNTKNESTILKGDTCDGHSYKDIFMADQDGNMIKELILYYVN